MTEPTPTQQLTQAAKAIVDAYARLTKQVLSVIKAPAFQTLLRQHNDHQYVTRIADQERVIFADWFDNHLDQVYADLGLDRTNDGSTT